MTNLLPCPFCGGSDIRLHPPGPTGNPAIAVCDVCSVALGVDIWNARAPDARLARAVEALQLIARTILLFGEECADGHSDCDTIARAALAEIEGIV